MALGGMGGYIYIYYIIYIPLDSDEDWPKTEAYQDPMTRISPYDALMHPWLMEDRPIAMLDDGRFLESGGS